MRGRRRSVDGKPLDSCLERREGTATRVDTDIGVAVTVGVGDRSGSRDVEATRCGTIGSHAVAHGRGRR